MVWCRAATMVSIALARPSAQGWPGTISCSLHNSSNAGDTPAPDYRWVSKIDKWHSFPRTQRQTYPEPQELWAPNPCRPYYPLLIIPTTALCRCPQNWSETGTLLRLCSNIGIFQVDFFFLIWVPQRISKFPHKQQRWTACLRLVEHSAFPNCASQSDLWLMNLAPVPRWWERK